jgi:hypothetical protein
MRITPRSHVIGSPRSEFQTQTLPHRPNDGNNMPKDVGEVETQVQCLSHGGWLPPGRKVGWGGELRWLAQRTGAQRQNGPSHGPSNTPLVIAANNRILACKCS